MKHPTPPPPLPNDVEVRATVIQHARPYKQPEPPSESVMLYHTTVPEIFVSLFPHTSVPIIKIQIEFGLVSQQNYDDK